MYSLYCFCPVSCLLRKWRAESEYLYLVHSRLQNKAALLCFLNESVLLSLQEYIQRFYFPLRPQLPLWTPIFFYFSFPGCFCFLPFSLLLSFPPPTLLEKTKETVPYRLSLLSVFLWVRRNILKMSPIQDSLLTFFSTSRIGMTEVCNKQGVDLCTPFQLQNHLSVTRIIAFGREYNF